MWPIADLRSNMSCSASSTFDQELGIGRSLVYELVRRGELKEVRRFGRLLRIHRDALRVPQPIRGTLPPLD
jgi:excisionase family DNA binding protein